VAVLRIDQGTGALTDTGSRLVTPTPTHVLAPQPRPEAVR
jgi:hypothetical protein